MSILSRVLLTCAILMQVVPAGAADGSDPPGIIDLTRAENGPITMADFMWKNRLVVVLADTPDDPRFIEQVELLLEHSDALAERHVLVLTDSDPSARSEFRVSLRPRGFAIVLIGKDGQVKLRKPFPWSVREISRAIDKTPERQRELRQGS